MTSETLTSGLQNLSLKDDKHPTEALSVEEIETACKFVLKKRNTERLQFVRSVFTEPRKQLLRPYLDAEFEGKELPPKPPRVVELLYVMPQDKPAYFKFFRSLVQIQPTLEEVELKELEDTPPLDIELLLRASDMVMKNEKFRSILRDLGVKNLDAVVVDPWMYGVDRADRRPFELACYCYSKDPTKNPSESNFYAFPLPVIPVIDVNTWEIVRFEDMATGGDEDNLDVKTNTKNILDHMTPNEYDPELVENHRKDLKPYIVNQPEGASFTIEGNKILWQKWSMFLGWNSREGMVLYDVRYDGGKVFYRVSMSEMCVPYGDPRHPFYRKMAFDLGDLGAGSNANNLQLGCDCLGAIKYFEGAISMNSGKGEVLKNVVCMHEQDMGIGWKHVNLFSLKPVVTRNRQLVLQQIFTVSNYEYIFAYNFDQSAAMHLEVRATGILSTSPIDPGKRYKYGNIVSPGALAANHQHLFCLRVDPAIDGDKNSVIVDEVHPDPPSANENPQGNAFRSIKTYVEESSGLDCDAATNRIFKIVNESKKNPVSGNPVGYKLLPAATQLILAHPDSFQYRRAKFASHHVWVTKYREGDLWSGGDMTNMATDEINGCYDMAQRKDKVRNEDLVFWHAFGLTHLPRVEDFPVMPVDILRASLVPADFFDKNPSVDVPPSNQNFNQSQLIGSNGQCCR